MRVVPLSCLLLVLTVCPMHASAQDSDPNQIVDPDRFDALSYRMVGPFRGGRVTAVTGVADQPTTFFMGSTGGGVWKTTDAGTTWENITDGYLTAGSIGAVAVAPSDPNVLYVGTGSACPRGNVSPGDGVYRSTDGGETWTKIGLEESGQIAKILVHPDNPDRLYVAALGNVFGRHPERGVFRSDDGGRSWRHVLAHSDSVGAVDLQMDPSNPRILYAGLWRVERKPWTMIDGSSEGGVWKSTDGGETWARLQGGLPAGVIGRPGIAVSPARPQRVWVVLEAAEPGKGGLFRSDDGGRSWEKVSGNRELLTRHWYYSHVTADPQDENTVYVLNVDFFRSVDGGRTFEEISVPHGDNHDLWINPHDPEIMIQANDGGANVSFNGGKTWSTQLNQPTAEFYRVTVDNQFPYRIYGAQQDNSTISIPSTSPGGLTPQAHWYEVGGGESGHIAVDPRNADIVYAGNYIGQITRRNLDAGHERNVTAYPQMHDGLAPRDIRYRFQWNAPIRISPHDPDVLYHASQYVHRSTDGGQTWEIISPDLTTNNDRYHDIPGGPVQHDHTGVELYTTIFSLEESPLEPGVLWAGSDDGLVHVSRNGGATWLDVTPADMPSEGTVNTIEISSHVPGRVFLAVYRYRDNDFRPYVFRTTDYGASWDLLTDGRNGIPQDQFVRVVREDPDRLGLLYAGTEFGMYVSFDDGTHWQPFQLDLPVTPITDLAVHRDDLVVATQGRSFWVLDDLTPLHEIGIDPDESPFTLYDPRTAYRTQFSGFNGPATPESAPRGAVFHADIRSEIDTATTVVRLDVLDRSGAVARTFSSRPDSSKHDLLLPIRKGLNRWVWDLRYTPPDRIEGSFMSLADLRGPVAPPGAYQVRLTVGESAQTRTFQVEKDPRWPAEDADLVAQFELTNEVLSTFNEVHDAVRTIRFVRNQVHEVARRAVRAGHPDTLRAAADSIGARLTFIEDVLIQSRHEAGQDPINFPPRLDDQVAYLYTIVNRQDERPTRGSYQRLDDLRAEIAPSLNRLQEVLEEDVAAFNELLETSGVPRIIPHPGR